MKKTRFLALIVICGLLQITVLDAVSLFGVKPDLLLICAVYAGFIFELRQAVCFSLFAGIFKDTFSGHPFYQNSILFVLWVIFIQRLTRKITVDEDLSRGILIFLIVTLHNIISGMILIYPQRLFIPTGNFVRIVFAGSLYSAACLPVIFWMLKRIKS